MIAIEPKEPGAYIVDFEPRQDERGFSAIWWPPVDRTIISPTDDMSPSVAAAATVV